MELIQDNSRSMVNEDRLSSLPDELIHRILSCIDIKFAIQTCLLSPRWKLLWKSMPYLNFSSWYFGSLPKFAKFVNHVLNHRNHQIQVSLVKLRFDGAASQVFVRKIAKYAFAHNVKELSIISFPKENRNYPPCLFSSPSLKCFTFRAQSIPLPGRCLTPVTPWDFPALTTMHLSRIVLCGYTTTVPVDLFSKCVNLKNLTLEWFFVGAVDVFDINSPQLSNLMLIDGSDLKNLNLITPQLEKLTITNCGINYLKAPSGLSSFCYRGYHPLMLPKDCLHSLNEVNIHIHSYSSNVQYTEEDTRRTVNMLQELQSAKFLTLNIDIVECISAFPGLLSHHPSPFSNLTCLIIDTSHRKDAYNFKMSTEAKVFLLENSPSATFIMELPEEPPTKAMRQKEARARRNANFVAEVESHMIKLQASLEQGQTIFSEIKQQKERAFATLRSLVADLSVWAKEKMTQREQAKKFVDLESHKGETQMQFDEGNTQQADKKRPKIDLGEVVESHKEEMQMMQVEEAEVLIDSHKAETQLYGGTVDAENDEVLAGQKAQIWPCLRKMQDLIEQQYAYVEAIVTKEVRIRILLEKLPKRQSADIEKRYSHEFGEAKAQCSSMRTEFVSFNECIHELTKVLSDISTVSDRKLPVASQSTIPPPST